jgi:hypothetical protein
MRARSDGTWMVALLIAIASATLACTKKPTSATSPGAHGGEPQPQSADDLLAQLDSLEHEMRRLGLPVAAARAPVPAAEEPGRDGDAAAGARTEELEDESPAPTEAEAGVEAAPPPEKREAAQRCEAVCDLSQAICELEVAICSLSDGHGDDPTYTDACARAGEDCDTADDACDHCAT